VNRRFDSDLCLLSLDTPQIDMAENNVVATYYYPTAAPAAMEVCGAELGQGKPDKCFDDDGRPKRNGT
jgi:hypothetical protein